jgi:hypothetical protein
VDEYLQVIKIIKGRTSLPPILCHAIQAGTDVWAAGDIAYFPYAHSVDPASAYVRIEHWDVATDQVLNAARPIDLVSTSRFEYRAALPRLTCWMARSRMLWCPSSGLLK